MPLVSLNGNFLDADHPYLDGTNRSFKFGDGLFETIRIVEGKPFNLESHYKRIIEGLDILKINMADFSLSYLNEQIKELAENNSVNKGGRARLSIFRQGTGAYAPISMGGDYLLELEPIDFNYFPLNEDGLSVDIYDDVQKPINALSPFKTSNALFYIMASISAKEKGLDDVLMLNENKAIIESTASNLFIVSNGVLYTPSVEDGCVGGTFRMYLINLAIQNNIKVYECSLLPQNLYAADEIFLTNAIQGIRWVSSYKSKRYYCETTKKLIDLVNKSIFTKIQEGEIVNSVEGFQEN